jgi:exonuclease III
LRLSTSTDASPTASNGLANARPDVACLQELKAEKMAFQDEALRAAGHNAVWQTGYNTPACLFTTD